MDKNLAKKHNMKIYEIRYRGKIVARLTALCSDFARLSYIQSHPKKLALSDVTAMEVE
jgi:hypothetical protein